jgi:hypothetical protein
VFGRVLWLQPLFVTKYNYNVMVTLCFNYGNSMTFIWPINNVAVITISLKIINAFKDINEAATFKYVGTHTFVH